MNVMERIRKRHSVRSYDQQEVSVGIREKLQQLFQEHSRGPFETVVRFALLDLGSVSPAELRSLGTYGMIRGARLYILGAVKDIAGSQTDLGYCLEKIILEATALGLGTCWMGGTFRRSSFARWMQLAKDELLPAITPVGYPGYPVKNRILRGRFFRSGSHPRRKPWRELFFTGDGTTPLCEEEAGPYRNALEAVRLGPSATNRQPWRIIRDYGGRYRLYLKEDRLYNRALGKLRMQQIDIGIAMSHFELAARDQSIDGRWNPGAPALHLPGLEHIALWETGGF